MGKHSEIFLGIVIVGIFGVIVVIFLIGGVSMLLRFRQPKLINSPYYQKKAFTISEDVKEATPTARMPVKVPILLYHYVEYVKDKGDTIRQSLDIVPRVFEEQIQTLLSDSYTFITMDELADYLDGEQSLPPKPIIITFDDGYRDLRTDVLPILQKYHVKAVAYIVSGLWINQILCRRRSYVKSPQAGWLSAHRTSPESQSDKA